MNQSGNVISGGPVDAGVAGGLPMEPRTTDVEAWRAQIEAKRAKNAASRARLERALASQQAAAVVPRPAPRPAPESEEPAERMPADIPAPVAVTAEPDPVAAEPPAPVDAPEPPAPAEPTRTPEPRPRPAQARSPHARGPREIPAAALADAVRAYLAGTPLEALARQHKIGHERMRTLLIDAGVQIRPKSHAGGNHRPTVDQKAIAADYEAGKSAPQIASERGHSTATVRRALRAEGVELRDDRAGRPRDGARTRFTPEQVAAMAVDYHNGASLAAIAAEHGTRSTFVRDALAAANVPIRPPGQNARPAEGPPPVVPIPNAEPEPEESVVVIDGTHGFTTPDDIAALADDVEPAYVAAIREAEASGQLLTGLDIFDAPVFPLFPPATEHHLTPTLTALADHLEAVVGLVREIAVALTRKDTTS